MKHYNINRWSMAALALALVLAWSGSAVAQGRGGPPSRDDDREPPTAADFIKRLDKDGDGKVSKDEFDGPDKHFTELDKNEDGYITEDEAPTGPPPREGGRGGKGGERR
ncbi:MAG: hypothetical protein HN919_21110 [Verrucomicrobia bacterium]|jgi:hypothetical protein|nr:hypothetical protein [Verrucomicrobiota bacterium]MBT7702100.1 hypothetical protein [Verrucomicrobiota bacterium]